MPPVFRYATLSGVKSRVGAEFLLDDGGSTLLTDAAILKIIESASSQINEWTRQVFQPVPESVRISSNGRRLIAHPQSLPFLVLEEIAQDSLRSIPSYKGLQRIIPDYEASLESRYYGSSGISIKDMSGTIEVGWEPGNRQASLLRRDTGLHAGFLNVELSGWWGWLENLKSFSTTLASGIAANTSNATSLSLVDIQDASSGDFLEVGDTLAVQVQARTESPLTLPKRVELAIIKDISGSGPYTITVDTLHAYPVAIASGAPVRSFGRIPTALADVAEFLAVQLVKKAVADLGGNAALGGASEGTLIGERTDNYSYQLSYGPSGRINPGSLGKYTGSPRMDLVLREFVRPELEVRFF